MKRTLLSLFYFGLTIIIPTTAFAQVGINTTNPRTTLEVAGDTHIDGAINVGSLNPVTTIDNTALLGQIGTNHVKELNVNTEGVAIAYFQEYTLTNMDGDWISNLNTQISSTDYVVTIISAYFNKPLVGSMGSAENYFTVPAASAFIQGGTWHIRADYPSTAPASSTPTGEWVISTLILSNDFSKQFPLQEFTLSGSSNQRRSGAATTPIID